MRSLSIISLTILSILLSSCRLVKQKESSPLTIRDMYKFIEAKQFAFPESAELYEPKESTDSAEYIYAFRNKFDVDKKTLIEIDAISETMYDSEDEYQVWLVDDDSDPFKLGILGKSSEISNYLSLSYQDDQSLQQYGSIKIMKSDSDNAQYSAPFKKNPELNH